MNKIKYLLFTLICILSFSNVLAANEVVIKNMVPEYDENNGVKVKEENGVHKVIFNDKNQSVKYNIVLQNNTKKDIHIADIVLPKPSENFLKYEFLDLKDDGVLTANSTKDVVLSIKTVETEGWGRNFNIDLTANIDVGSNVANPNTKSNESLLTLVIITATIGGTIILIKNKKIKRYIVLIIMFSSVITITTAKYTIELPINLQVSFESQNIMKPSYVIENDTKTMVDYWSYANKIKNIYIQNEVNEISTYFKKFDVSNNKDKRVIAYLVTNNENTEFYDLYLQSDGILYLNPDASMYFANMTNLEKIDNMEGIGTDNIINMSYMFAETGYNSDNFNLDVSKFNTSKTTNMQYMFYNTGANSKTFNLDVSNFNTSNVTNMNSMFSGTGYYSTLIKLDVSNFDTSNVTDMGYLFANAGVSNESFNLDVSNFDTSKVTNMSYMFSGTGFSSKDLEIDVSNFDTSNVTTMEYMFYQTGYSNPNFTLDISNFDTSKVTTMYAMFCHTGAESEVLSLDFSNFDTSNVTDMSYMFAYAGSYTKNLDLDLSSFDTSKVEDMSSMFTHMGMHSTKITLNLNSFNTTNVKNMRNMFENTGFYADTFDLNVSNFNTQNVTNMKNMFFQTGHYSPNFTLALGPNFTTTKINDMSYMFSGAGFNSKKLTLDVSSFDTSNVTNMYKMFYQTGYSSTEFNMDLSHFDFSNAQSIGYFLYNTGYSSNKFNTTIYLNNKDLSSSNLFGDSFSKPGSSMIIDYNSRTSVLASSIISTHSNANVTKGKLRKVYIDDALIGDEIVIGNQKFYVIDNYDTTLTLLSALSLNESGKQSTTPYEVPFASASGWEYEPGPKEIEPQYYGTDISNLLNIFVTDLRNETRDNSIIADLATLEQLSYVGCDPYFDYYYDSSESFTCPIFSWLNSSKKWWTRSAVSNYPNSIWHAANGKLETSHYEEEATVRPVIIVSKDTIKKIVNNQMNPQ